MKKRYRYIHFEEVLDCGWYCYNNGSHARLGTATYYPQWEQWVMDFQEDCVFNIQCLRDIADFLGQLNKKSSKQSAKGEKK